VKAAAPAPAPADDGTGKPLDVNVWGRIGNVLQNPKDSEKLNDAQVDAEVDLLLGGKIHKYVGWTADFVATYGGGTMSGNASILDLIGKFDFADPINVWFGRMLVPSDRSNFSGPWFMGPWTYPGFYQAGKPPVGPRQGPFGRNDGATVWGQFGGGLFKYYAGVFDLHDGGESPLFSGRLNLSLLSPEPGFYHSSVYYGGKDILAIAVGAQFKNNGSSNGDMVMPMANDYTEFNADALFEKNLGAGGVINAEAAFYKYAGDFEAIDYNYYGVVSYLTPSEVGIGKLHPLFRIQQAKPKGGGDTWTIIDGQVGYAIKEYAARLALGYERIDAAGAKSNAVFLGIQLQK
jgi:hypothetical protein